MEKIHVVALPWLSLWQPITIGPFVFAPFVPDDEEDSAPQFSPEITEHLQRIADCHINVGGDHIDHLCLCHLRDGEVFVELTSEQRDQLRLAVNIMGFASIGHQTVQAIISDNGLSPPTAERFEVSFFTTMVGQQQLAVEGGRINRSLEGGYTLNKIRFSAPLGLGSTPSPDEDVLEGLSQGLFGSALAPELRNRIARALEWFVRAHSESPALSDASVMVMMSTAFECLLAPPNQDKKLFIADFFHDIRLNGDAMETMEVSRRGKKVLETKAKQAWDAYDLYNLRNDIVHGNEIEANRFVFMTPKRSLHKRIIAAALFWEAVLKVLSDAGLVGGGAKGLVDAWRNAGVEVNDEAFEARWRAHLFSIDDLHQALGWV